MRRLLLQALSLLGEGRGGELQRPRPAVLPEGGGLRRDHRGDAPEGRGRAERPPAQRSRLCGLRRPG